MPGHSIIVIGASAGGVEALTELVGRLPRDLPAAVFVAVHFPASSVSLLPQILSRLKTLPAHHAIDGEPIEPGQIYIAPPNHHLLMDSGRVRLSQGPRENGHRPAIDVLFRSAAYAYRERVIGVILTGTLDDGVAGLLTIKSQKGKAIVQDPKEALFDGMPCNAIRTVGVDWVLKLAEIAYLLIDLSKTALTQTAQNPPQNLLFLNAQDANSQSPIPQAPMSDSSKPDSSKPLLDESEQVAHNKSLLEHGEMPEQTAASPITCPDCGGVLWELRENSQLRFRCHVGHAYSLDSLLEEQAQDVEKSLWTAVRALEEKAALARRMAAHARQQSRTRSIEQFEERAKESSQHAQVIRELILNQLNRRAELHPNGG